jgi:hypothetical protein
MIPETGIDQPFEKGSRLGNENGEAQDGKRLLHPVHFPRDEQ